MAIVTTTGGCLSLRSPSETRHSVSVVVDVTEEMRRNGAKTISVQVTTDGRYLTGTTVPVADTKQYQISLSVSRGSARTFAIDIIADQSVLFHNVRTVDVFGDGLVVKFEPSP